MKQKINFKCKVCSRRYQLTQEEILRVPIWKMENCSKTCSLLCSSKKLLNLTTCSISPKSF